MPEPLVQVTAPDAEGTAVLTLNRPEKKNALSVALREEANRSLALLAADEGVKALVVTGAGGSFSAGFDMAEFADRDPDHVKRLWASSDEFHEAMRRFPVPTVAAVDGVAYAGGFDLAVLCDLRLASQSARFAHPESTFGPVVYGPLHDLVGGALARELVLTGRKVNAEAALRMHLVTEVVTAEDLGARAIALAHEISRAPREILVRNKSKIIARSAIAPGSITLDL